MDFILVNPADDLSAVVRVLNVSHGTVAKDFGFTKDNNPTNNAFIDELCVMLKTATLVYFRCVVDKNYPNRCRLMYRLIIYLDRLKHRKVVFLNQNLMQVSGLYCL